MDFADLERKFEPRKGMRDTPNRVKAIVLCNPHNPVGRVWRREELTRLGDIVIGNGAKVISDEIHSDLVYKEYKHTPFASISDEFAQHSIICTSPSKTFNLAGLQTSIITIANPILRNEFLNMLEDNGMMSPNIFGIVALKASYTYGAEWLDELLNYLKENLEFLIRFLEERLPSIKIIKPQGTYLVWLDFRSLGMTPQELSNFLLKKAKIALDDGFIFGQGGEGFERMNIACPRSTLEEGLIRIEKAIKVRNEWDE
jgi:cystathionine beta-lyase